MGKTLPIMSSRNIIRSASYSQSWRNISGASFGTAQSFLQSIRQQIELAANGHAMAMGHQRNSQFPADLPRSQTILWYVTLSDINPAN